MLCYGCRQEYPDDKLTNIGGKVDVDAEGNTHLIGGHQYCPTCLQIKAGRGDFNEEEL